MGDWLPIEGAPEGVVVDTKTDDANGSRNEQTLIRKGRLWFFPDMSMYVYYTPTHYRKPLALTSGGAKKEAPNAKG